MKYLLIALLFLSSIDRPFAQQISRISDINFLVGQINGMKLKSQLQPGNITYTLMSDTLQGRLRKVIVNDTNYKKTTDYYFNNDQLIYINSPFGRYYFRDDDFTQGTSNWKDDNDLGLLKRERQIATAYRFVIMYKKSQASIKPEKTLELQKTTTSSEQQ